MQKKETRKLGPYFVLNCSTGTPWVSAVIGLLWHRSSSQLLDLYLSHINWMWINETCYFDMHIMFSSRISFHLGVFKRIYYWNYENISLFAHANCIGRST
jgi:hypothetical protein